MKDTWFFDLNRKAQVKEMKQMTILLNKNLGVMKLNKRSLLLPFTNKKKTREKTQ
jgi:hypothetical protein